MGKILQEAQWNVLNVLIWRQKQLKYLFVCDRKKVLTNFLSYVAAEVDVVFVGKHVDKVTHGLIPLTD